MDEPAIEYDFPEGLPAFEHEKLFRFREPSAIHPLALLESACTPGLRFVCIAVEWLDGEYQLQLSEEEEGILGGAAKLRCFALIAFPEQGTPTANLRSPVVLNPATRRGIQCIQSEPR